MTGHRVVFAQIGARRGYSDAVALHWLGVLHEMHTDFYNPFGEPLERVLDKLPGHFKRISRLAHCYNPALANARIVSHYLIAAMKVIRLRFRYSKDPAGYLEKLSAINASFASRVRRRANNGFTIYMGFADASLELLELCHDTGKIGILWQHDTGPEHWLTTNSECKKWPGWEKEFQRMPELHFARVRKEWELANHILVSSEWAQSALIRQGVDSKKINVIPMSYEYNGAVPKARAKFSVNQPLRVLWIGTVCVMKGFPCFVEAARLLKSAPIEFIVIGESRISREIMDNLPNNMRYLGALPRRLAHEYYSICDLFVFPTLSDGFGITQLEAISRGLPVITTPNCGQVVEDGKHGFVLPPGDSISLADRIERFLLEPRLVFEMSRSAIERSTQFSTKILRDNYSKFFSRKVG
jgi:glycosyltransferase involved in cell wall biosynthesis